MDATSIAALLQESIAGAPGGPGAIVAAGAHIESLPSIDLQATIAVSRDLLLPCARALRERLDLDFACLLEITAADFWPREPRFELVYTLVSLSHKLRLRLKVRLQSDDARVATVSGLWPAANWLEREVWDLFGIAFDGHPDPRRLLMPEDWDGYPLRKDYPVQIRKTPTAAEPLQVTAEEFRANVARDRLTRR
jgi:NADH-quinone oxidoreductase subunit C